MKTRVEFMSPLEERIQAQCVTVTVWLLILLVLFLVSLSSCTSSDIRALSWPGPPLPGGSGRLYSHVSDNAPEALKPFYDEDLTRKLNEH